MKKRAMAGLVFTAAAFGCMVGVAGAVPEQDHKKGFPVECQTGTLAGETLTIVTSKTVYTEDGDRLRLTTLRIEFDGKVKDKQFGKTVGSITCGGSETSPEGTFTFFARLTPA